jgi:hypothetical protein
MEQIIPKEKIDEFMKINGEIRGATLRAYGDFVFKEMG